MNDPMAKIMRLDSEKSQSLIHSAHRLTAAGKLARQHYHRTPLTRDFSAEQDAINAWPTVTVCYSGIEQAIKFLLKIQGKLKERDKYESDSHWVGALFQKLTEEEREVIRESYSIYQSLYDHIEPKTADDFLREIDKGYTTWRYFLLDGIPPPTTHCGAMLEIWFALGNIIEARVFKNRRLYHCADRFHTYLSKCIYRAWEKYTDPETGAEKATVEDLNRWFGSWDRLLISWAKVLQGHATSTSELDVLPHTEKILLESIDIARECARSDHDFSYFIYRTEEHGIVWDHQAKRFEAS